MSVCRVELSGQKTGSVKLNFLQNVAPKILETSTFLGCQGFKYFRCRCRSSVLFSMFPVTEVLCSHSSTHPQIPRNSIMVLPGSHSGFSLYSKSSS